MSKYDNNTLGHENGSHPMHDQEQEITLQHVMGRLTIDEADFLENHITNLVKEAKRTFENAKRLQAEIDAKRKDMENIQTSYLGKDIPAAEQRQFDILYKECGDLEDKLHKLLTL